VGIEKWQTEKSSIVIQSFNGIGDLLFVTPTLRRLKEANPSIHITVNTNYPDLLKFNPFVDVVGSDRVGGKLSYPDPIHCKEPTCHHIMSDWKIITNAINFKMKPPKFFPEIYLPLPCRGDNIGIQVLHKRQWGGKKVWPYFKELAELYSPIPHVNSIIELVEFIASCKLVVCAEGGISHIAKAVGTHAIVIYGGWCNPEWNGYVDQINVVNKVDCSYCYNSHLCKEDHKCLKEISVKSVKEIVRHQITTAQDV